jgi:hypothetical protein
MIDRGVPRPTTKREYEALTNEQRHEVDRAYPDFDYSDLPSR